MVNKLEPIEKSRLIDRVRFGERYLRDCINKIVNKNPSRKKKIQKPQDKNKSKDNHTSPYEDLEISKENTHSLDTEV